MNHSMYPLVLLKVMGPALTVYFESNLAEFIFSCDVKMTKQVFLKSIDVPKQTSRCSNISESGEPLPATAEKQYK